MKFGSIWSAIFLVFVGFGFGFWSRGCSSSASKKEATKAFAATQWIGRFVAGDGDGRIFSAPMIELGLRSDGVIAWRTKQPEPFSLISTQRAEAK